MTIDKKEININEISTNFSSKILQTIYRDESFVGYILWIVSWNKISPWELRDRLAIAREEYKKNI